MCLPGTFVQGGGVGGVVLFHYTPKHASWMNQAEIWLSILVRKLLKRGAFRSRDDLRDQILAFIAYYNRTMAKPIKWTYTGLSPDRGIFCPLEALQHISEYVIGAFPGPLR